jgi:hypothetical protein
MYDHVLIRFGRVGIMHTFRDYHAAPVSNCDQDRRYAVPDRSLLTQNEIMPADALGQVSLDISSSCHPR